MTMPTRLFFIAVLTIHTSLAFGQNMEVIDSLLSRANQYKNTNPDSLELVIGQLENFANDKNKLSEIIALKRLESLIRFNYYDVADSVLSSLEITKDMDTTYVDFVIAKGRILNNKERYDAALKQYYEALSIAKSINYTEVVPEVYMEIATVLRKNNDVENTLKYLHFGVNESRKQHNTKLEANALIMLCKAYNGWITLNLDSSVHYGRKAIALSEFENYDRGIIDAKMVAAAPIIRIGNFREGLEMSKESLLVADKYNFSIKDRYYLLGNLGFAYEGLNMFDSAMFYARKAEELRPEGLDIYRLQYTILKAQGKYKKALEALEVYELKHADLLRNRNQEKYSELQARYEANLKEQEVEALTQKNEYQELQLTQQRYLFAGLVLLVLLLSGSLFLFYRQRKLRQKQELTKNELDETQKRLELEKQYRASELKAIRSQMNPHFVFNALNSIQEYIVSNERKLAGKYLGKFADLMRIYLEHSQVKTITLREEMEALNLYLELEKLRFEDSMHYEIKIDENVDKEMVIPSLLLQPYVENAIKHGLLHRNGDRHLSIQVENNEEKQYMICTIVDNGVGRAESLKINQMRNPEHKSFASQATRSRLDLLNHDRQQPITEEIEDLVDENNKGIGTKVIIKIPLGNV